MSLIQVIIYTLIALGPIPDKIYFRDGRWLSNTARLRLAQGILCYPHPLNEVFRVPSTWLDLARTLRPKPPQSKAATAYKGVPWDHPAFAKKTRSQRPISLTTEGLSTYVEKYPRLIYDAGPEPEPVPSEDPYALLKKKPKKQSATPKEPKPEKPKGSGRKRKQTRRSKALGEDDSFFENPSEAEGEPEAFSDKTAPPSHSKPPIQQSRNQGEHGRIVAPALRMRRWSPHRPNPAVEWLFSMPLPAPLGHGGLGWIS